MLLSFQKEGIYCEQGQFYIDPWSPVNKAIITHAHSDHARQGHRTYLAHQQSIPILEQRLGNIKAEGLNYGKRINMNGVMVSLHPAGHILGSSQIRVEYKGETWVVSGDYKTEPDPIAEDFEPVKCHTFITESTFGLPIYQWPDIRQVIAQIEEWWKANQNEGKISILSAYALGKAQRLLALLDASIGPIFSHGAVDRVNEIHKKMNLLSGDFPYLTNSVSKHALAGSLVIAPPSAIGSSWSNKLHPFSVGIASGWMMLRGSKRRQNVDRGFVLSDHADWKGLNEAIEETGATRVICTHGYADPFCQWLEHNGYDAYSEKTIFEDHGLDSTGDSQ